MTKKNKISKKINKIIPAVLLSGAMLMPISQLTSPIIVNAFESSSYSNLEDSKTYLSKLDFKTTSEKENVASDENFKFDGTVGILSDTYVTFNLEKKYSELSGYLYNNQICGLNFEFFLDGKPADVLLNDKPIKGKITVNSDSNTDIPQICINNLDNVDELKIRVTKEDPNNNYSNFSFFGKIKDAVLIEKK